MSSPIKMNVLFPHQSSKLQLSWRGKTGVKETRANSQSLRDRVYASCTSFLQAFDCHNDWSLVRNTAFDDDQPTSRFRSWLPLPCPRMGLQLTTVLKIRQHLGQWKFITNLCMSSYAQKPGCLESLDNQGHQVPTKTLHVAKKCWRSAAIWKHVSGPAHGHVRMSF